MITLKIKPYNKTEVKLLQELLRGCLFTVQGKHCDRDCDECPVRHLCVDLQSAQLHAEDTVKKLGANQ